MADTFGSCLAFTLGEEGGFVDDPNDPGGATNMGVTLATLRSWEGAPALGVAAVRELSRAAASAIYGADYWNRLRCDALPAGLDLATFDFGVNAGPARAARTLQAALGFSGEELDGEIGPATLAAAGAADPATALATLSAQQAAYYRALPGFATYGRGWLARASRRQAAAAALVAPSRASVNLKETTGMKRIRTWLRQPTTVAGISAAFGTLSALLLGQLRWEAAVPLLVGAAIGMVLPDNAGAEVSVEKLVTDAIDAAEVVVTGRQASVVVQPATPAASRTGG